MTTINTSPPFSFQTSHSSGPFNEEEGNFDTTCFSLPKNCFASDGITIVVPAVNKLIRLFFDQITVSMLRHIHHAEFVFTNDPEELKTRGLKHDCHRCRSQLDQALAYLAEKPNEQLAVGTVWYVPLNESK